MSLFVQARLLIVWRQEIPGWRLFPDRGGFNRHGPDTPWLKERGPFFDRNIIRTKLNKKNTFLDDFLDHFFVFVGSLFGSFLFFLVFFLLFMFDVSSIFLGFFVVLLASQGFGGSERVSHLRAMLCHLKRLGVHNLALQLAGAEPGASLFFFAGPEPHRFICRSPLARDNGQKATPG